MQGTSKKLKNNKSGIVLITSLLIMVLLAALSAFFIGSMLSEFRIATANKGGTISFYVAESGIEEAIIKVKNDPIFNANFINGTLNSSNGTFSRDPFLIAGSSYTVIIESLAPGEAKITSTSKYKTGILTAQRIVMAKIIKGTNPNPPWNNALYAASGINVHGTTLNISNGDMFSNNGMHIFGHGNINLTNDALTNGDIDVHPNSTFTVGGTKKAQNFPPAADTVQMPMLDFDSNDPDSFLNQATAIYTQQDFDNLLKNNSPLSLSGIIYVRGDVNIKKNQVLTVTGLLVSDGNINIGTTGSGGPDSASLTINKPADGSVSGVLTKAKLKIGVHAGNVNINGLVYCNDQQAHFDNFGYELNVTGGIIAREISFINIVRPVNVTFDSDRVSKVLSQAYNFSPTVQVEHWEENY